MHFFGHTPLSISNALRIARGTLPIGLHEKTIFKLKASAAIVEDIRKGDAPVYGINTGFGFFCNTQISHENIRLLQEKLLKSHAVGVGSYLSKETAKLMLILKIQALCQGYSGVSVALVKKLIFWLEHDLIPAVPEKGSLGASGDLAPLAHLFLPLLHLGEIHHQGAIKSAKEVLEKANCSAYTLQAKEGLALINGTQYIAAHSVQIVERFHRCLSHADLIGALMVDALMGSAQPFDPRLHQLRPFSGVRYVAHRLHSLLEGSEILKSHTHCLRVQDPYSLRCMPQVHGASRATWLHLKELTATEVNAVTDNPIIIDAETVISGGSFHGQPLAMALDYATLALSELGNISDRRIYLSLEGKTDGTPKMLVDDPGLNSGLMILQYTTAALVNENKSLCYPASADSIPTCLGQEDHVSMGATAARKAITVAENVEQILALELIAACQALDYRIPLKTSKALQEIVKRVRKTIPHLKEDVFISQYIRAANELLQSGTLIDVLDQHMSLKENTAFSDFETY